MIPAVIDIDRIIADLNRAGWLDYKIEVACGFARGYVAQLKRREDRDVLYKHGARLFNFWEDTERGTRGPPDLCVACGQPVPYVRCQTLSNTT